MVKKVLRIAVQASTVVQKSIGYLGAIENTSKHVSRTFQCNQKSSESVLGNIGVIKYNFETLVQLA